MSFISFSCKLVTVKPTFTHIIYSNVCDLLSFSVLASHEAHPAWSRQGHLPQAPGGGARTTTRLRYALVLMCASYIYFSCLLACSGRWAGREGACVRLVKEKGRTRMHHILGMSVNNFLVAISTCVAHDVR